MIKLKNILYEIKTYPKLRLNWDDPTIILGWHPGLGRGAPIFMVNIGRYMVDYNVSRSGENIIIHRSGNVKVIEKSKMYPHDADHIQNYLKPLYDAGKYKIV